MSKKFFGISLIVLAIILLVILMATFFVRSLAIRSLSGDLSEENLPSDGNISDDMVPDEGYKNIEYTIDGKKVLLKGGMAESESAPGSSSKIVTRYFGNELRTDLNNDGLEDIVFLVTQETGGSGTFYYAVAAIAVPSSAQSDALSGEENIGYIGSDGYFLGDRIAPQTTELSKNPKHKNVIVINFADRAIGEPMTTKPSVGKSAYLKLDTQNMIWGVVLSPEESESL